MHALKNENEEQIYNANNTHIYFYHYIESFASNYNEQVVNALEEEKGAEYLQISTLLPILTIMFDLYISTNSCYHTKGDNPFTGI